MTRKKIANTNERVHTFFFFLSLSLTLSLSHILSLAHSHSHYISLSFARSLSISFSLTHTGDAQVLKVYAPAFIGKEIVQSTPWPNMENTMTLSLVTNVNLYSPPAPAAPATITISGLTGTQTANDANLVLLVPAGSPFEASAEWRQSGGRLIAVLKRSATLVAGTHTTLSFVLKNPSAQMSGRAVDISCDYSSLNLDGSQTRKQLPSAPMSTPMLLVPSVLMASAGDAGNCLPTRLHFRSITEPSSLVSHCVFFSSSFGFLSCLPLHVPAPTTSQYPL